MKRVLALIYGGVSYLVFFTSFVYAVGFVENFFVPRTIDRGVESPLVTALIINTLLLTAFAVQHSVMARQPFKRMITRVISPSVERSTYVLMASLLLWLLLWQWRPLPQTVWNISNVAVAYALTAVSLLGWGMVLLSTFLISHVDLFGLKQVMQYFRNEKYSYPGFRTPGLYKVVRHPIYLGFMLAFWSTPKMTLGHLLFAVATTAYIFVGATLEERDLVSFHGRDYENYRQSVPMFLPTGKKTSKSDASAAGRP